MTKGNKAESSEVYKSFTLTKAAYHYVIGCVIAIVIIFLVSVVFSAYAFWVHQGDKQHLQQLQEVNSLQQQQLSELEQRANKLQAQLGELLKLRSELQQLQQGSGQAPSSWNTSIGQGGPHTAPLSLSEVRKTYTNLESSMRHEHVNLQTLNQQLRQVIVQQRLAKLGPINTVPSIWPTTGVISSPFGLRWHGTDFHPGIDIANDEGTPIRATADGVVTAAGWNSGGYGNMVDIEHGHGIMTRYGHASYVAVHIGQRVKRGQVIAYMGSTGYSTGPHVHYEVRVNNRPVNPASYMVN